MNSLSAELAHSMLSINLTIWTANYQGMERSKSIAAVKQFDQGLCWVHCLVVRQNVLLSEHFWKTRNVFAKTLCPPPIYASDNQVIYSSAPISSQSFNALPQIVIKIWLWRMDDPKSNMPLQLLGSWGHNYGKNIYTVYLDWLQSLVTKYFFLIICLIIH